ncbi:xanthine dehydrogenase family protein molybdopterin-binding subunit [Lichenihabitans psoromatis]|uniref:xanthine dehydrogenase family protein molybdopterin-binding subunit n=1 Tax=Lichenihabitans psoromatis TaxID=2528642 RepID=UPI001FDF5306|nr:xanthine dehydrogenase family protein molybdopterin-binding subunit [Lichenihabitans psoromatis]
MMVDAAAPAPKANMGQPVPRYDARAKVTGSALYASDVGLPDVAYAYLVSSTIAKGRIASFDLKAALALPGVLDILTHETIGDAIKPVKFFTEGGPASNTVVPLASAEIAYGGQTIAMVLANSYEVARDAAHRVIVTYEIASPSSTFDSKGAVDQELASQNKKHEDPKVGDFATAYAAAPVTVDVAYSTPTQHHNPIELFATQCSWNGSQLTVHEPSQNVYGIKNGLAAQLGIDASQVRVISPYIGGAFGSKGGLTQRTAIVAIAARKLGRPVKLVATRDQGFTIATYRAETKHRIKLGADRNGKLQALSHDGFEVTSRHDPYAVAGTDASTRMYACPNIASNVTIVRADRSTPGFMRAPAETPYFFALESAMDELAVALKMDPVELRRINDTQHEPIKGLPYTSRTLMPCFDQAAEAFGWSKRTPQPGSMRDGDWLIGYGCATSAYPTQMAAATARVSLFPDGTARVETASHEIGNGIYTVVAQTAAERLGLPYEKISVLLGDTILPPAPVAGGSISTASVCSVVAQACDAIRAKLSDGPTPVTDLVAALKDRGMGSLQEYAEWTPHGAPKGAVQMLYRGAAQPTGGAKLADRIQFAFGAQFVEVRVHARTREIRVPRIVGAFASGHIMNTRTAHSQYMGGMIWGIGSALHEQTEIDTNAARYLNTNLADYLVPVNADVIDVQVIMVPEEDSAINPLGIKGIGEIGIVGTSAAVANAVFHATGQRVRDLPLRIDTLVAGA